MLLQELLHLYEGRLDYTATTLGDKLLAAQEKDSSADKKLSALELVKELTKADPTKNQQHIVWIAKMYVAGLFKLEDISKIKEEITLFEKVKSKLANKDLNSYKTLTSLYDVLQPYYDKSEEDLMSNKAKTAAVKSDAKVFIDEPGFKVVIPVSHEAAKVYGSGTKWCTSGETCEQYDNYSKQGPLFIVLADIDGKKRKFQLHYETGSFMDERDTEVSKADITKLSKLDGYKKFLNKLVQKHYKQHIE